MNLMRAELTANSFNLQCGNLTLKHTAGQQIHKPKLSWTKSMVCLMVVWLSTRWDTILPNALVHHILGWTVKHKYTGGLCLEWNCGELGLQEECPDCCDGGLLAGALHSNTSSRTNPATQHFGAKSSAWSCHRSSRHTAQSGEIIAYKLPARAQTKMIGFKYWSQLQTDKK